MSLYEEMFGLVGQLGAQLRAGTPPGRPRWDRRGRTPRRR